MAESISLELAAREVKGKEVGRLRKQGILPGVLYGWHVSDPTPVQVETRTFERVYLHAGASTLIDVTVGGSKRKAQALIHNVKRDPVTQALAHFDLMAVNPQEEITSDVPVVLVGEAPGSRLADAVLIHETNTIHLRALPANLPPVIEVDVTGLEEVDQAIYVRDLPAIDNVTILTDPDHLVAKLTEIRVPADLEEVEAAEAAEEIEEEGEAAEAEAESEGEES